MNTRTVESSCLDLVPVCNGQKCASQIHDMNLVSPDDDFVQIDYIVQIHQRIPVSTATRLLITGHIDP